MSSLFSIHPLPRTDNEVHKSFSRTRHYKPILLISSWEKKNYGKFLKVFLLRTRAFIITPLLDHCDMFKYKPPMENGMKPSGKRCHSFYPRKFPLEVLFVQKTFRWTIFPAESSRYLVLFLHYLQQWGGTMQLLLITALKIWRTASPRALSNKHNRTNSCKST